MLQKGLVKLNLEDHKIIIMKRTPFKMKGFSGFGNSPLKHPHEGRQAHPSTGHNTDTGKSVAEGGVPNVDNPNYKKWKEKQEKESPTKQVVNEDAIPKVKLPKKLVGNMPTEEQSKKQKGELFERDLTGFRRYDRVGTKAEQYEKRLSGMTRRGKQLHKMIIKTVGKKYEK